MPNEGTAEPFSDAEDRLDWWPPGFAFNVDELLWVDPWDEEELDDDVEEEQGAMVVVGWLG